MKMSQYLKYLNMKKKNKLNKKMRIMKVQIRKNAQKNNKSLKS